MRKVFRAAGWLLSVVIVVLSVIPAEERPITPVPHDLEHLAIFLVTGLAFGVGYTSRHLLQAFWVVTFAGIIELIQLMIPGRHSRLSDFVVDALGGVVGVGLGAVITRRFTRFRH